MCQYALAYWLLMSALLWFALEYQQNPIFRPVTETVWGLNIRHYSKLMGDLSAATHRRLDREFASDIGNDLVEPPSLVPPTSFFDGRLEVSVSSPSQAASIHVSRDGSIPTRRHPRAEHPIPITATTVIRAKSFDSQGRFSSTVTASYVPLPSADLNVVSIAMDPVHLTNKHVGIAVNPFQRGRAWERPAQVAVLSSRSGKVYEGNATVRIHGSSSRTNRRTSLRLYDGPTGTDLRPLFAEEGGHASPAQEEWILRHVGNNHQLHRDRLGRRVARQMGLLVGSEVPCLLYVNGELWGVYDLTEPVNQQFLSERVGGGPFVVQNGGIFRPTRKFVYPDFTKSDDWNSIYSFIEKSRVQDSAIYEKVTEYVDISQFVDYMILAIFSGDPDRPWNNMDFFRDNTPQSKWGFVVWDLDGGFNNRGEGIEHDSLAWHLREQPTPQLKTRGRPDSWQMVKSTVVLRSLMQNEQFRSEFTNRFHELLDSVLSATQLHATFDDLLSDYRATEETEGLRFEDGSSATSYEEQLRQIRDFLTERPAYVRQILQLHLP